MAWAAGSRHAGSRRQYTWAGRCAATRIAPGTGSTSCRSSSRRLNEHAKRSNRANNITGALAYVDGFFLQILEGERSRVEGLMEKIASDVRHDAVTIVHTGETSAAAFAEWDMAYVSATPEQVAEWAGFSPPTQLSSLFRDTGEDRQRVRRVAKCILAVLLEEPVSQSNDK